LSIRIEKLAAEGTMEGEGDVVRNVITSTIQFLYQRHTPVGTPGEPGVPLQLQSAAIATLGNVGNMVPVMKGDVKEVPNEALQSLLEVLREFAKDYAYWMKRGEARQLAAKQLVRQN
jgi:hypothetical protein